MLTNVTRVRPATGLAHRPQPAAAPAASLLPPRPCATDLLAPAAVADRLGVTSKALERWRGNGEGPAFVRLSRKTIRYRADDVEAFIAGRICTSTASA